MADLVLTDAQRDALFRARVLPLVFGADSATSVPRFTLVVGQPGAVASRATHRAIAEQPETTVLSAESLRVFHPRYTDLVRSSSPRAAAILSETAAEWATQSLAHARENEWPLLVEASISSAEGALRLTESFARRAFATRIVVVAVPREQSLLAIASSHLLDQRAGRASVIHTLAAHDESWNAVRALVGGQEASPTVDRLTLFDGAGAVLFDANATDDRVFAGASRALIAAHSAPMTNASAMQWLSELRAATDYALADGPLDRSTADVLLELQRIAAREVLPQIALPAESLARVNASAAISERVERLRRAVAATEVDAAAPAITVPDVGIGLSR